MRKGQTRPGQAQPKPRGSAAAKARGSAASRKPRRRAASATRRRTRGVPGGVLAAGLVALAVAALFGVFLAANGRGGNGEAGAYPYAVGSPGPGSAAPAIRLPATDGRTFDLTASRGKTTLLYFQEGLGCQPCWDQLNDIEANLSKYRALGIDQVVSITTDPLDALNQKAADEGLATPVLADPDLSVSRAYNANQYGMMGQSRDGHSFIVVGPDGAIRWRADYGGAPKYTMYVPGDSLLADLRTGLGGQGR
jgi:peroxiredoxin